jgi:hypothetical protein
MREFRPSVRKHIQPFLEWIAGAGLIFVFAVWKGELESGTMMSLGFVIGGIVTFFLHRGWKRPLLYVIEGERLQAGPRMIDFSRQENIISVNRIGRHKIEIVIQDSIPVVIDFHPLGKEDRNHLTEFIKARTAER